MPLTPEQSESIRSKIALAFTSYTGVALGAFEQALLDAQQAISDAPEFDQVSAQPILKYLAERTAAIKKDNNLDALSTVAKPLYDVCRARYCATAVVSAPVFTEEPPSLRMEPDYRLLKKACNQKQPDIKSIKQLLRGVNTIDLNNDTLDLNEVNSQILAKALEGNQSITTLVGCRDVDSEIIKNCSNVKTLGAVYWVKNFRLTDFPTIKHLEHDDYGGYLNGLLNDLNSNTSLERLDINSESPGEVRDWDAPFLLLNITLKELTLNKIVNSSNTKEFTAILARLPGIEKLCFNDVFIKPEHFPLLTTATQSLPKLKCLRIIREGVSDIDPVVQVLSNQSDAIRVKRLELSPHIGYQGLVALAELMEKNLFITELAYDIVAIAEPTFEPKLQKLLQRINSYLERNRKKSEPVQTLLLQQTLLSQSSSSSSSSVLAISPPQQLGSKKEVKSQELPAKTSRGVKRGAGSSDKVLSEQHKKAKTPLTWCSFHTPPQTGDTSQSSSLDSVEEPTNSRFEDDKLYMINPSTKGFL